MPPLSRFLSAALLMFSSIALADPAASPYRRFIEAEDMTIEGKGYAVVAHAQRNAGGVMACSFATDDAAKAGGRIVTNLERELPPGKYLVWLTALLLAEPKGPPLDIEVHLGKTGATLRLERGERAAGAVVVEAAHPFKTLAIALRNAHKRLWIDTLYFSSVPSDLRVDRARKEVEIDTELIQWEMAGDAPAAPATEPANWIGNGSFETGIAANEWSTLYQSLHSIRPDYWSTDSPADGERCLRLPLYRHSDAPGAPAAFRMIHRVMKLKPNSQYFLRGMFKSDVPVTVTLSGETAYGARAGIGQSRTVLGNKWQAVSVPLKTTSDARGYHLRISAEAAGPATIWVDALSLTATPADSFVAAAPVEFGVCWKEPGKVFHSDAPVSFDFLARNYSAAPATVALRWRVVDYFDQTAAEGAVKDWSLPPTATQRRAVQVLQGRTGAFRLLIEGDAQAGGAKLGLPLQEYVFCVVPPPPEKMERNIGAYISLVPDAVEIMSRAGIRKTTTLSCGNTLLEEWAAMEPKQGQFVWWDDRVALARKCGMKIVANLQIARATDVPEWARVPKDTPDAIGNKAVSFPRAAWERFVEAAAAHYRADIQDWLIVDEPYSTFTPEQYAALLKATYAAAKRGNPGCRVIAHGGYTDEWLPGVEKAGGVPHFDGISDYARVPTRGSMLRDFARKHGKFLINVEYGPHASMYRTIEAPDNPRDRRTPDYYLRNTEGVVEGAVRAMSWSGSQGFGRYDARFPGGDFTKLDRHKCMFEYDGALKPAGVAYALMAQILDGFHGVEELKLRPDVETHLFESADRFVLAFWTRDGVVMDAGIAPPAGVKALDIMGNPLPAAATLSGSLAWLTGPKAQSAAAQAWLKDLAVTPTVEIATQTVLDPKSSQYMLLVRIANRSRHPLPPGTCQLSQHAMRDFWTGGLPVPDIAPGRTADLRIGLNAYAGDKPHPRPADLEYTFGGVMLRLQIKSVFDVPGGKVQ